MRQLLCSLLENWLARCGYQDELRRRKWELTGTDLLCRSGPLFVGDNISVHVLQMPTNKHPQIGAGNLTVKHLGRVTVESTMVRKPAKYRIQTRNVQGDILLFAPRVEWLRNLAQCFLYINNFSKKPSSGPG